MKKTLHSIGTLAVFCLVILTSLTFYVTDSRSDVGIEGNAYENDGIGVKGTASDYAKWGGYFTSYGDYGIGVEGIASNFESIGVYGRALDYALWGGCFESYGERGNGVRGISLNNPYGGRGVEGLALSTGESDINFGGFFKALGGKGIGVSGIATYAEGGTRNYGGCFSADGGEGIGVHGKATYAEGGTRNYGGWFEAAGEYGYGVYGLSTGPYGVGVYGHSEGADGMSIYGRSSGTNAMSIYSSASGEYGDAVHAYASGIYGTAIDAEARGSGGCAIQGVATGGSWAVAGSFVGDVIVHGDFSVLGSKNFINPHPTDPSKEIVYVCLEGGENGVYVRGSGQLVDGRTEIELPEHFGLVASEKGLTVQVTPRDGKAKGYLFVEEVTTDHIVIGESGGGTSDARFDYLVMGVRYGFEDHQVIRENRHVKPGCKMSQEQYEEWLALPKNRGMQQLLMENGTLTPEGRINRKTAEQLGWELGPETKAELMERFNRLEHVEPPEPLAPEEIGAYRSPRRDEVCRGDEALSSSMN